jgi:hypothetical protein
MERMRDRVEKMEREEARLKAERSRVFRPAQYSKRTWNGFGRGVVPKAQWKPGELRVTQEALQVIADHIVDGKTQWYGKRDSVAQKAGVSTAVLKEYGKKIQNGEIVFDENTQKWILRPVQS